ncbi:CLCA_X family protein [Arsukibacterium sp.]|uniref:CLCA_X family protein n=1 Tax=Arsukibacterium sp. TaxID=1977258 RepID=UPI00299E4696|nr:CLCA_X family protein [Arsukibacterium sp.]MDX1539287.1 CLCA_X family protein [Arsukibacterium sp.]
MADGLSRQYYRNGPPHRAGADVSFGDLVKIFGFNSIHIGRWVQRDEQQQAANLFFDALCDLQLLLQVPEQVISLNGSLALTYGIGGQRGVCAHYQPQGRILALAKNAGGGSLAHEWFHAFDHYIAGKMFCLLPSADRFASRCWLDGMAVKAHPLKELLQQAFQTLYLSDNGQNESDFFKQCRTLDATRQQLYLAMPEEMAARAFENMLQRQPLKNSFLVAGTLQSKAAKMGIYPNERLSLALSQLWLPYFRALGVSLRAKTSLISGTV